MQLCGEGVLQEPLSPERRPPQEEKRIGALNSCPFVQHSSARARLNAELSTCAQVGLGDLLDLTSTTDATGEAQSARSARRVRVLTVHELPSGSARTKLRVWRSPIPLNS